MDYEIYHKRRTKLREGDDFLLLVRDGVCSMTRIGGNMIKLVLVLVLVAFAKAVPGQRQPGPTSNFQSGNFPQPLSVQTPSMGPYAGSSSNLPPVPQWPATTRGFQPYNASFPPGQTQQFIIPGTPSLFSSNYPVAGPGSVLPGSIAPGYVSSSSASAFPAANFPPFVVCPGFPPVAPKIVAAIVSGEFIELASLLEDHTCPSLRLIT